MQTEESEQCKVTEERLVKDYRLARGQLSLTIQTKIYETTRETGSKVTYKTIHCLQYTVDFWDFGYYSNSLVT